MIAPTRRTLDWRQSPEVRINCYYLSVLTDEQCVALRGSQAGDFGARSAVASGAARLAPEAVDLSASPRQRALLTLADRGLDPLLLQSTTLLCLEPGISALTVERTVDLLASRHRLLRLRAAGTDRLQPADQSPPVTVDGDLVTAQAWAREPLLPTVALWNVQGFSSSDGFVLGVKTHDVGFDQRSVDILVEELVAILDSRGELPDSDDFFSVLSELKALGEETPDAADAMADDLLVAGGQEVQGDLPGPPGHGPTLSVRTAVTDFSRIAAHAARAQVTPYVIQLSALLVGLRGLDGHQRRAIGITVDRRPLVDADNVIGPLSQGAVLTVDLNGVSDDDIPAIVRGRLLELLMEQGTSFEHVVQSWRGRDCRLDQLAAVTVNHRHVQRRWPTTQGQVVQVESPVPIAGPAGADVMITLEQEWNRLSLQFDVNARRYSAAWVEKLANATRTALETWASAPTFN